MKQKEGMLVAHKQRVDSHLNKKGFVSFIACVDARACVSERVSERVSEGDAYGQTCP